MRKVGIEMKDYSFGNYICKLRERRGLSQFQLGALVGVTDKAVSKWENDNSCPDIMLLPKLAKTLGVTVDVLLTGESKPETRMLPPAELKPAAQRIMRIVVNSGDGDKVRVNLPLGMINAFIQAGVSMDNFQMSGGDALGKIDFAQVLALADQGIIGKMIEVESSIGDLVEIWVE